MTLAGFVTCARTVDRKPIARQCSASHPVHAALYKHRLTPDPSAHVQVLYVDLDAHQGNGVERDKLHFHDKDLFIIDAYNRCATGSPPSIPPVLASLMFTIEPDNSRARKTISCRMQG
jgi:hypothetical protein